MIQLPSRCISYIQKNQRIKTSLLNYTMPPYFWKQKGWKHLKQLGNMIQLNNIILISFPAIWSPLASATAHQISNILHFRHNPCCRQLIACIKPSTLHFFFLKEGVGRFYQHLPSILKVCFMYLYLFNPTGHWVKCVFDPQKSRHNIACSFLFWDCSDTSDSVWAIWTPNFVTGISYQEPGSSACTLHT